MSVDFYARGAVGMNLANVNARTMLTVLGFDTSDLYGDADIPTCRRAIMRARNVGLEAYAREEYIQHGPPRDNGDGTVELRPVRVWAQGCNAERIREYVDRFEKLVDDAERVGAQKVEWS